MKTIFQKGVRISAFIAMLALIFTACEIGGGDESESSNPIIGVWKLTVKYYDMGGGVYTTFTYPYHYSQGSLHSTSWDYYVMSETKNELYEKFTESNLPEYPVGIYHHTDYDKPISISGDIVTYPAYSGIVEKWTISGDTVTITFPNGDPTEYTTAVRVSDSEIAGAVPAP